MPGPVCERYQIAHVMLVHDAVIPDVRLCRATQKLSSQWWQRVARMTLRIGLRVHYGLVES